MNARRFFYFFARRIMATLISLPYYQSTVSLYFAVQQWTCMTAGGWRMSACGRSALYYVCKANACCSCVYRSIYKFASYAILYYQKFILSIQFTRAEKLLILHTITEKVTFSRMRKISCNKIIIYNVITVIQLVRKLCHLLVKKRPESVADFFKFYAFRHTFLSGHDVPRRKSTCTVRRSAPLNRTAFRRHDGFRLQQIICLRHVIIY